jgi:WD40 repeat protein
MTESTSTANDREQRLEEAIAAYYQASEEGQPFERTMFLAHYPDLAADLAAFLDDKDAFEKRAGAPATPAWAATTLGADETPPVLLGKVRYFGDYELLDEIARGGMGVVYKARQVSLNRVVALKMILAGQLASAADVRRFHAEAEAAANLDHPHILPIYEIGERQGQHYFSMKLIEGGSLAQFRPRLIQDHHADARLVVTVARAVHYAHQRGILHRDLKPANILLDADGTPFVSDFGLAKRVERGCVGAPSAEGLTQSGAIVGTPSYMAPEQARADRALSTAADVYSLGAILYELLTGRPPFHAATPLDTLLQVLEREPERPRAVNPRIDRDLETVCLKCLHKEPTRRYESASALADDLERWLAAKPVNARPVGRGERAWRWCRRNPLVAGLLGVVAVCIVVAAVLLNRERTQTLSNLGRAEDAEKDLREQLARTETAEREKTDRLWQSYLDQARARRFSRQMGQRFDSLDALTRAARLRPDPRLRDEVIACLALPDLRAGKPWPIWPEGTVYLVFDGDYQRYARTDDRGNITVHELASDREIRRIPSPGRTVGAMALSPDGRFLTVHRQPTNAFQVWNVDTGQVMVKEESGPSGSGFRPDSREVAFCRADGTIQLVDLTTGKETNRLHTGEPTSMLAYHPGGGQLAAAAYRGSPRIYDLASGNLLARLPGIRLLHFDWHPNGQRLALAAADGRAYVWDVSSQRLVATMEGHAQDVSSISFHPSGTLIATQSWDGTTRLWNASTGRPLLTRAGTYHSARFSQDGRTLGYIPEGRDVRLMEVAAGLEYRTLVSSLGAGEGEYRHLDVSPDGRLLAVGMEDGVRLWELASGREVAHIRQRQTYSVLFQPDGTGLLTCGKAGLRDWPIRPDEQVPNRFRTGPPQGIRVRGLLHRASRCADGRTLAVASEEPRVALVVDLQGIPLERAVLAHPKLDRAVISPDGRLVVTAGWHSQEIKVWDAQVGKLVKELPPESGTLNTFSPDGRTLINCRSDEYCFHDTATWQVKLRVRRMQSGYAGPAAFTADGRIVALELSPGIVHLTEAGTGRTLAKLEDPNHDRATHLCFAPDGSRLVCLAHYSRVIHIWDLRSIHEQLSAMGLGWKQSFGAASSKAADPPLSIRLEQVAPEVPPIVAWSPAARRRTATAAQIANWIEQLRDARQRAAAGKALEEVGTPAIAELTRVAAGGDANVSQQAREVLDRIAVAEALTPTRVGLKLNGATIEEAVKALARQAGMPLTYQPRQRSVPPPRKKITLELNGVPFWEALDQLCEAAELVYSMRYTASGPALRLLDGMPPPRGRITYAGPFRLQATGVSSSQSLALLNKGANRSRQLTLTINQRVEPANAILLGFAPRVLEARDAAGQSLQSKSPSRLIGSTSPGVPILGYSVPLQVPRQPGGQLRDFRAVLPVEVMLRRQDLITIGDLPLSRARRQTFQGAGGIHLTLEDVRSEAGQVQVDLSMKGPSTWTYDGRLSSFELQDAQGRRYRPIARLLDRRPTEARAEDVPWEWKGRISFRVPGGPASCCRLTFFSFERRRVELPFAFHDLPLP